MKCSDKNVKRLCFQTETTSTDAVDQALNNSVSTTTAMNSTTDQIPSALFSFFSARHDGILTLIFFPRTLTIVELQTSTHHACQLNQQHTETSEHKLDWKHNNLVMVRCYVLSNDIRLNKMLCIHNF